MTKKAKEVGRRGTKRKALLYEGPTVCRTESPKKVAKVVQKEDTTGNFEEQIEKFARSGDTELKFPASLTTYDRMLVHKAAEKAGE